MFFFERKLFTLIQNQTYFFNLATKVATFITFVRKLTKIKISTYLNYQYGIKGYGGRGEEEFVYLVTSYKLVKRIVFLFLVHPSCYALACIYIHIYKVLVLSHNNGLIII
jgi:hypothetical protein